MNTYITAERVIVKDFVCDVRVVVDECVLSVGLETLRLVIVSFRVRK